MDQPTENQIRTWTRALAASDRAAFDCLFRHWYPRLIRYAARYTSDRSSAGDIVQDAFISLWEKRDTLDPSRSLKAYMYRIVRNRALNHIRDHSSRMVDLDAAGITSLSHEARAEPDEDTASALRARIRQWVKELPQRQQEAFELSRYEGLEHDEIADVMDISSNTVNNHIVAALQHMRERYDAYKQTETLH